MFVIVLALNTMCCPHKGVCDDDVKREGVEQLQGTYISHIIDRHRRQKNDNPNIQLVVDDAPYDRHSITLKYFGRN